MSLAAAMLGVITALTVSLFTTARFVMVASRDWMLVRGLPVRAVHGWGGAVTVAGALPGMAAICGVRTRLD